MLEDKYKLERVNLSINSICNLSCRYCYFYNPARKLNKGMELTSEEIYQILQNIHDYSKEFKIAKKIKVNFVGSGEPLISWNKIKDGIEKYNSINQNSELRFYTVSNGLLINRKILREMKKIGLTPSLSIDGPKLIHDKNRITNDGKSTFDRVINSLKLLQEEGFEIIINPSITWDLLNNINSFFNFVEEFKISKVIFGRLIDTPSNFKSVSSDDYYNGLIRIYNKWKNFDYFFEIGNFTSYKRAFTKNPDITCTVYGSICGGGFTNIIYLLRDVYPCGRFFDIKEWRIGRFNYPLKIILENMKKKYKSILENKLIKFQEMYCKNCEVSEFCIKDCFYEQSFIENYSCNSRRKFIKILYNDYIQKSTKINKL
ncbi:MAG: radical SAM protein [Candidatus Helarchaeota archaeon]